MPNWKEQFLKSRGIHLFPRVFIGLDHVDTDNIFFNSKTMYSNNFSFSFYPNLISSKCACKHHTTA